VYHPIYVETSIHNKCRCLFYCALLTQHVSAPIGGHLQVVCNTKNSKAVTVHVNGSVGGFYIYIYIDCYTPNKMHNPMIKIHKESHQPLPQFSLKISEDSSKIPTAVSVREAWMAYCLPTGLLHGDVVAMSRDATDGPRNTTACHHNSQSSIYVTKPWACKHIPPVQSERRLRAYMLHGTGSPEIREPQVEVYLRPAVPSRAKLH
jgi:hypothetical protein